MTITSVNLLQDLIERTRININQAQEFNSISTEKLNWKAEQNSWSVLECFEHLNLYGDFYIPEIKKSIESSKTKPQENFKSGILGNYFAKSMLPKEKLNKMKTFNDKNPIGSKLDKLTIERFILQQKEIFINPFARNIEKYPIDIVQYRMLADPAKVANGAVINIFALNEKHFYEFSNQFVMGDGIVIDAKP